MSRHYRDCPVYRQFLDEWSQIIRSRRYRDYPCFVEKWKGVTHEWYGEPEEIFSSDYTEEDYIQVATSRMAFELDIRVKTLRRIQSIYRSNVGIENEVFRVEKVRKKFRRMRGGLLDLRWSPFDYPMSKLNIKRLKYL